MEDHNSDPELRDSFPGAIELIKHNVSITPKHVI